MVEPLASIVARFDIHNNPEFPLNGRAYILGTNFKEAYESSIPFAVRYLRGTVEDEKFEDHRNEGYRHVVAIISGYVTEGGKVYNLIDFFGFKFQRWKDDVEIFQWREGGDNILSRYTGVVPVLRESGLCIVQAEIEYRRKSTMRAFQEVGPKIPELSDENDFCTPLGRKRLRKLLRETDR